MITVFLSDQNHPEIKFLEVGYFFSALLLVAIRGPVRLCYKLIY